MVGKYSHRHCIHRDQRYLADHHGLDILHCKEVVACTLANTSNRSSSAVC